MGLAAVAFTSEERQRIDDAIQTIEQRTGAALDFMINRASDRYLLYPLIWAGCGALLATVLVALLWPNLDDRETIFIEISILIVLMLAFDWLPIRIWLVPVRVKHAHARQLAHRRFADHVANDDLHRSRILVFVSLAEHYVEIIADHATHALVAGSVWNAIVDEFVAAIRANRVAEGALAALAACGGILERHPAHSSDKIRT
jgi:putative membrane protein